MQENCFWAAVVAEAALFTLLDVYNRHLLVILTILALFSSSKKKQYDGLIARVSHHTRNDRVGVDSSLRLI